MAISLKRKAPSKRGPGYWKFNNSLLDNAKYIANIENALTEIIKLNINSQTKWELCKIEIRNTTIDFSKRIGRERNNRLSKLEKELKHLYEILDQSQDELLLTHIQILETEINDLYKIKTIGAQIRSKVDFIEQGEKNTKYFLGLEKSRQTRKVINSIKFNNTRLTDIHEILNAEKAFYKDLYTSKLNIDRNYYNYVNNIK